MNGNPSDNRVELGKLLAKRVNSAGELDALLSKLEDDEVSKYLAVLNSADVLIAATERKLELLKEMREGLGQAAIRLGDQRRGK